MKKTITSLALLAATAAFAQTTTYQQYGNTTYGSDGSVYQQYGNTTYGPNGSMAQQYGNTIYVTPGIQPIQPPQLPPQAVPPRTYGVEPIQPFQPYPVYRSR